MSKERMLKVIEMETEAETLLEKTKSEVDRIKTNKHELTEKEIYEATYLISKAQDIIEKISEVGIKDMKG